MKMEFRNPLDLKEKNIVKDILSLENDMWYSDIDLGKIFVLIVDEKIVGCWRIVKYLDNSKELASVAVKKEFRWKWFWKILIEKLLNNQKNIYTICEKEKEKMYEKFGFKFINDELIPKYILEKLIEERVRFPNDNSICMITY